MKASAILGLIVAAHLFGQVVGCAAAKDAARAVDDANDPADDVALKRCRTEARAIKADGGAAQEAFDAYLACTVDAGLR